MDYGHIFKSMSLAVQTPLLTLFHIITQVFFGISFTSFLWDTKPAEQLCNCMKKPKISKRSRLAFLIDLNQLDFLKTTIEELRLQLSVDGNALEFSGIEYPNIIEATLSSAKSLENKENRRIESPDYVADITFRHCFCASAIEDLSKSLKEALFIFYVEKMGASHTSINDAIGDRLRTFENDGNNNHDAIISCADYGSLIYPPTSNVILPNKSPGGSNGGVHDIEITFSDENIAENIKFHPGRKNEPMAAMISESDSGFSDLKKVRFDLNPKVHVMRTWAFAYRLARKGDWEVYARDRTRFHQRIRRAAIYLDPILSYEHRSIIFKSRFSD